MDDRREKKSGGPRTLGWHFLKALREAHAWRPASFYLLFAIPVVMILAAPAFYMRDNPRRFALHLALLFVFLFVIMLRAAVDCLEILRKHRSEQQRAFHAIFSRDDTPESDSPEGPQDKK